MLLLSCKNVLVCKSFDLIVAWKELGSWSGSLGVFDWRQNGHDSHQQPVQSLRLRVQSQSSPVNSRAGQKTQSANHCWRDLWTFCKLSIFMQIFVIFYLMFKSISMLSVVISSRDRSAQKIVCFIRLYYFSNIRIFTYLF